MQKKKPKLGSMHNDFYWIIRAAFMMDRIQELVGAHSPLDYENFSQFSSVK